MHNTAEHLELCERHGWSWGDREPVLHSLDAARASYRQAHDHVFPLRSEPSSRPFLQARVVSVRPLRVEFAALQYARAADGEQPWLLLGHAEPRAGALEITALLTAPLLEESAVSSGTMRKLSLPALLASLRFYLSTVGTDPESMWIEGAQAEGLKQAAIIADTAPSRGPGRPPIIADADHARMARYYLELQEQGITRGIHAALQARWKTETGQNLALTTIKARICTCRNRGYLGPAPKQGRVGAQPGPRLRQPQRRHLPQ